GTSTGLPFLRFYAQERLVNGLLFASHVLLDFVSCPVAYHNSYVAVGNRHTFHIHGTGVLHDEGFRYEYPLIFHSRSFYLLSLLLRKLLHLEERMERTMDIHLPFPLHCLDVLNLQIE